MLEHHIVFGNAFELDFSFALKVAGAYEPRLEVTVMRRERLDPFTCSLRGGELRFKVAHFALERAEFGTLVFL